MKLKNLILTASLMYGAATIAQTTVSLTPTKDASVGFHYGYPSDDTNYGNSVHYSGFSQPSATAELGENAGWGIMNFDWSTIPEGATITSATLNLYHFGPGFSIPLPTGHEGNNKCWLVRITEDWSESTVTWNTRPALTTLHRVSLAKSTSPDEDYTDIDVTALVQDMIDNPTAGYGFCLKLKHEHPTSGLMFASTDFADASRWPELVVTYTTETEGRQSITENPIYNYGLNLKVFPNPTVNEFHAEFNLESAANVTWELRDVTGKLYLAESLGQTDKGTMKLNIPLTDKSIGSGVYLFTIIADNKKQTIQVNIQ